MPSWPACWERRCWPLWGCGSDRGSPEDLEELETAVAVLSISTSETLSKLAGEASAELRNYVLANAAHQAARPRGSAMEPGSYQRALSEWRVGNKAVETARDNWKDLRAAFVKAARADLDALK